MNSLFTNDPLARLAPGLKKLGNPSINVRLPQSLLDIVDACCGRYECERATFMRYLLTRELQWAQTGVAPAGPMIELGGYESKPEV